VGEGNFAVRQRAKLEMTSATGLPVGIYIFPLQTQYLLLGFYKEEYPHLFLPKKEASAQRNNSFILEENAENSGLDWTLTS